MAEMRTTFETFPSPKSTSSTGRKTTFGTG